VVGSGLNAADGAADAAAGVGVARVADIGGDPAHAEMTAATRGTVSDRKIITLLYMLASAQVPPDTSPRCNTASL
jgi:hypothetical protein